MKLQEILDKIDATITPVEELLTVFAPQTLPAALAFQTGLSIIRKIFASKPAGVDYTQEMINQIVDESKEDILTELDRMGITYDSETGIFTKEELPKEEEE